MTITDRRSPLREHLCEIAWHISEGREQPVTGYFVALAVGSGCPAPAETFDRLVQAVRDVTLFTAGVEGETAWLTMHGYKRDADSRLFWRVALPERVEAVLDELLAPAVAA